MRGPRRSEGGLQSVALEARVASCPPTRPSDSPPPPPPCRRASVVRPPLGDQRGRLLGVRRPSAPHLCCSCHFPLRPQTSPPAALKSLPGPRSPRPAATSPTAAPRATSTGSSSGARFSLTVRNPRQTPASPPARPAFHPPPREERSLRNAAAVTRLTAALLAHRNARARRPRQASCTPRASPTIPSSRLLGCIGWTL